MTVVDDTYTGHVEPQHATRRTLPGATIIKMSVGPMDNNTYLVTCSRTGETLLIDAANDPELLVKLVGEHAPKLALIVTTHQHFDHWQALEAVAGHRRAHRRAPTRRRTTTGRTDRFLAGGDTVSVGDLTFDVIHLRGHTPGSVALALRPTAERPPPTCSPAIVCSRAALGGQQLRRSSTP
jgi:glyoxylase-like metal-dependent hydrolase (beta-lactamase superfamily II)